MASKKGFTLVELLVVISLISLLSSIVLAALDSARAKATDALIMAQRSEVSKALELYFLSNGGYPNPDYVSGGGPTKNRTFYCVGATNCLLGGISIPTALPGVTIGSITSLPTISTTNGNTRGIIYLSCKSNTPFCDSTSDEKVAAQVISATRSKGLAEQLVGTHYLIQYTPLPLPGT